MKKILFALMFLFGAFALANVTTYAQSKTKSDAAKSTSQSGPIKIGVVDTQIIVSGLPEAIDANKMLTDLKQKYSDSLVTIQKDYTTKREQFEKQKAMMPADKQKETEDQLKAIENQYLQFRDDKFGNQGELVQLTEKILAPIREKVKKAIEDIAKEEGMNFVFDKATTNPVLLYSDDKYDITYKVLDMIKRGTKQ
jgi:outer membrane protein